MFEKRYQARLVGWDDRSRGLEHTFYTKRGAVNFVNRMEAYPSYPEGHLRWIVVDLKRYRIVYDSVIIQWRKAILDGR